MKNLSNDSLLMLIAAIFIMYRKSIHLYANVHCALEVSANSKVARCPLTYSRPAVSMKKALFKSMQ